MNDFDNQYFFVLQPRDDEKTVDVLPFLTPDESTAKLPFQYEVLPVGSKPLVFINGLKEMGKKYGYSFVRTPPSVLFAGNHPVVSGEIRDKLLKFDLPNLALQPAMYIDDWGKWHEDYWYMTFLDRLDCWDRQASDYEQGIEPIRLGGFELYQIYRFSLDEDVLKKVPLTERTIFQMGGAQEGFVVAHQSVAAVFRSAGNGAQVLSITDYPDKY
ncbi:MAG: hypothetical protein Q7V20_21805 [Aquabacterium sp.]|uniref:hypothetical protein n=1 Tax=Aquabacterium sp. TaxID=1872578 RepID=UPI0027237DED|nr:hypothetical protein [Aquabacterium sp.]MDO9006088.1 hypothetical protein [Aquabacterium sp.]